jgi:hypothetical protein
MSVCHHSWRRLALELPRAVQVLSLPVQRATMIQKRSDSHTSSTVCCPSVSLLLVVVVTAAAKLHAWFGLVVYLTGEGALVPFLGHLCPLPSHCSTLRLLFHSLALLRQMPSQLHFLHSTLNLSVTAFLRVSSRGASSVWRRTASRPLGPRASSPVVSMIHDLRHHHLRCHQQRRSHCLLAFARRRR